MLVLRRRFLEFHSFSRVIFRSVSRNTPLLPFAYCSCFAPSRGRSLPFAHASWPNALWFSSPL
ncbi:hypothetical protein SESBI_40493 [Sesbania bispinosa]|nr:hypothetical protein SESBI_40493 [Sesbania bispinosa]